MRPGRASPSLARVSRRARHGVILAALWGAAALAGCGLFGGGTPPAPPPEEQAAGAAGTADAPEAPARPPAPFSLGVLREAVNQAPPGSASQFLATIADELRWEEDVNQDLALRQAISEGQFDERVEPRLLGLFFRKGFSVLPSVGEGHEFARDSIVRGPAANRRFFARSRDPVRIIFLDQVDNIVIIYPKNAGQPQVFNRIPTSSVALRESRLDQYLN